MWWLKGPKKKLSIPDGLSIYRIIASPLSAVFIFLDERLIFGILILISFTTDALDGLLARKMKISSQRGAQLDSIGDAITFVVGLLGVLKFETAFVKEQAFLIILALGIYFIHLIAAYWRYGMPSSFHTYLAKISALFQGIFIIWAILFGIEYWLFYCVIIFGIMETIEEISLIILLPEWKSDVKGLYWVLKNQKKHP